MQPSSVGVAPAAAHAPLLRNFAASLQAYGFVLAARRTAPILMVLVGAGAVILHGAFGKRQARRSARAASQLGLLVTIETACQGLARRAGASPLAGLVRCGLFGAAKPSTNFMSIPRICRLTY
jgi:hypothetical protein